MSAAAAAVGLLVTSSILLVVMSLMMTVTQGQEMNKLSSPSQLADPKDGINYTALMDPNGPEVQFILFTNKNKPRNLKIGDFRTFDESGFNLSNPTKIIIHGFLSSFKEEVFVKTKNAYLLTDDYNIIGMDWSVLCEFEYFSAMRGAQLAGDALGKFINYLIRVGVDHGSIHAIGHSLGAHVAGMGGDAVKGGKIGRITGLDPAGPGYNDVPPNLRLDPGDARLVDIIHTYMRVLSLAQPLGHVDFYPNGGRFQPGCPDLYDIWKVPESIACNHGRAYMYFIESILNTNAFKAEKCNSVEEAIYSRCFQESDVYMGQEETYQVGLYYVKTRTQEPYSYT